MNPWTARMLLVLAAAGVVVAGRFEHSRSTNALDEARQAHYEVDALSKKVYDMEFRVRDCEISLGQIARRAP